MLLDGEFIGVWYGDEIPVGLRALIDAGRVVLEPIGPEPPLPPMMAMAGNLAAATARDVTHGFARLDAPAVAARLAICHACPEYRPSDGRCAKCGCFLMDAKADRPHEHCPLGKWPGD